MATRAQDRQWDEYCRAQTACEQWEQQARQTGDPRTLDTARACRAIAAERLIAIRRSGAGRAAVAALFVLALWPPAWPVYATATESLHAVVSMPMKVRRRPVEADQLILEEA